MNTPLSQFDWAVFVKEGVRIPTGKTPIAKSALEAAGYNISGTQQTRPAETHTSLPLPECENCSAAYPRSKIPMPNENCTGCGLPLELKQWRDTRYTPHIPAAFQ